MEQAQNNMGDIVINSMRSLQPRVQSTCGVHVGEQLPPLPQTIVRTPTAALNSLPTCPSTNPVVAAQMHPLDPRVTTLVIRSIPPKAYQEDILVLWPPSWRYNFLYLPYNPKQRRPVGYVFINFISHEAARLFYSRWDGQVLTLEGHTRSLSVQAARVQGVVDILEHLQTQGISQMTDYRHLPALFMGTDRISFRAVLKEWEARSTAVGHSHSTCDVD